MIQQPGPSFILSDMPKPVGLEACLDNILNDFYPNSNKLITQSPPLYPLKPLLYMLRATGSFNPNLLQQLAKRFTKYAPQGSEVFVTKSQLLRQLQNPDITVYKKQDYLIVYDLLKGDKEHLQISDIAYRQQHTNLVNSGKIKRQFSQDDILKILGSQMQKQQPIL